MDYSVCDQSMVLPVLQSDSIPLDSGRSTTERDELPNLGGDKVTGTIHTLSAPKDTQSDQEHHMPEAQSMTANTPPPNIEAYSTPSSDLCSDWLPLELRETFTLFHGNTAHNCLTSCPKGSRSWTMASVWRHSGVGPAMAYCRPGQPWQQIDYYQ